MKKIKRETLIDIFHIVRGYLGVLLVFGYALIYNSGISGIFGEQINMILQACDNGSILCPFN